MIWPVLIPLKSGRGFNPAVRAVQGDAGSLNPFEIRAGIQSTATQTQKFHFKS